ncbi:two-component sensor histidine kinase, partial [Klebsiella pneumoniae]|uniref:sensor histidine kinase n=1 Tax=Klebsiella pneumoniae TaxID=573 RepID=UPI000D48F30F
PDVTFEIHAEPWVTQGDPLSLKRALLNLLDNAAKWSPQGGSVRVWMQPIPPAASGLTAGTPASDGEEAAVEIRVADSGPGIPAADRKKVFDRFYRSINSRSMQGSGLGLSIVKQAVVNHGGAIIVDESDDGGALMRVVLPARRGTP